MKTGILTLPLHTNYGGLLQAYALQTVLENLGHEVFHLALRSRLPKLPAYKAPLTYLRRISRKIRGKQVQIFYERNCARELRVTRQFTDRFISKYIKCRYVDTFEDASLLDADAFVVGSDQVWRPRYFLGDIENAFLRFAEEKDIRRVAYAASFGTDEWEFTEDQTRECGRLLRKFDAVSVREKSGVDLCQRHFGADAKCLPDPVLLIPAESWLRLSEENEVTYGDGELLSYILDETTETSALKDSVAKMTGLKPFRVNSRVEDPDAPLEERIQPPVEDFLRGFRDAKYVVTDSFHACVFSILFHKPFIVYGNAGRGMSRVHSLLEIFGLEDRLAGGPSAVIPGNIDWARVDMILDGQREKAMDFLSAALP